MKRRRHRVDTLVEKEFWDGFFSRLGDGLGPDRGLEYRGVPAWYNEVARIAYSAGWEYADDVIEKLGTRRIGSPVKREIPGRVYADAYGAARIAC